MPLLLREYAALDTIRINAMPHVTHALLPLRLTASAHTGIGDITRSLLWRDTSSLGSTIHVVLGDIAHIAMSIIRLTTATAYTHVDVLLPINQSTRYILVQPTWMEVHRSHVPFL